MYDTFPFPTHFPSGIYICIYIYTHISIHTYIYIELLKSQCSVHSLCKITREQTSQNLRYPSPGNQEQSRPNRVTDGPPRPLHPQRPSLHHPRHPPPPYRWLQSLCEAMCMNPPPLQAWASGGSWAKAEPNSSTAHTVRRSHWASLLRPGRARGMTGCSSWRSLLPAVRTSVKGDLEKELNLYTSEVWGVAVRGGSSWRSILPEVRTRIKLTMEYIYIYTYIHTYIHTYIYKKWVAVRGVLYCLRSAQMLQLTMEYIYTCIYVYIYNTGRSSWRSLLPSRSLLIC